MKIGNFGAALLEAGAVNEGVTKWRLEHVIPKDTRTVYYCKGCGGEFKFVRCSRPSDNYFRCSKCGHEVEVTDIHLYATATEVEI